MYSDIDYYFFTVFTGHNNRWCSSDNINPATKLVIPAAA